MISTIIRKIFGTKDDREIKRVRRIVENINGFESKMESLSDDELRKKTDYFKGRIGNGERLNDILEEAFAVVREVSKRTLGLRHYDVQMIGGVILHEGKIAEMKTGEGKTLVATCPVYLNALAGKGVHVVTVNDYLAKRDMEWMSKIYNFLGLTTAVIYSDMDIDNRKAAYRADITYGTNNEFGFDYLRDNMKPSLELKVQRDLNFCIVDEVDSILVDEARTPLIISGAARDSLRHYKQFAAVVRKLEKDRDYEVDQKAGSVYISEEGISSVEKLLNIDNLYAPEYIDWTHFLNQSLRAKELFRKDKEYIVKNGKVIIVDEFTGRLMEGRRYSEGLHQAIEAKENVNVASENQTLATITLQNYFRMYKKVAGMTGTAKTEEGEFVHIYNLQVVVIPTNRPLARKDHSDLLYSTQRKKFEAVVEKIVKVSELGQPMLVGTTSIENSELLSSMLRKRSVKHSVLNAKHHQMEAEIVAQAGRLGAITIATNMAGRGTDILLGGNPEFLAKNEASKRRVDPAKIMDELKERCEFEKKKVLELGGLFILGTERHESRRIDNQLRGRAGRQGDPGESQFYISIEDELMKLFVPESFRDSMKLEVEKEDGNSMDHPLLSWAMESAQRRVESRNFSIRKQLLEYDDVMNKQREVVYSQRNKILGSGDLFEEISRAIIGTIESKAKTFLPYDKEKWETEEFITYMSKAFEYKVSSEQIEGQTKEELIESISQSLIDYYKHKSSNLQYSHRLEIEKSIMIEVIDGRWKENLKSLDALKEGINLQSYGQKDPVVEYKLGSFRIYEAMSNTIREEIASYLIRMEAK